MNSLQDFENTFILRLVPIFIKDIVLKYIYKFARKTQTLTISNIGIIDLPQEIKDYVNYFGVMSSTDNMQACLCTYNDKLSFIFTSHLINQEVQKNFIRFLSEQGLNIEINTNIVMEEEENEEMFKM